MCLGEASTTPDPSSVSRWEVVPASARGSFLQGAGAFGLDGCPSPTLGSSFCKFPHCSSTCRALWHGGHLLVCSQHHPGLLQPLVCGNQVSVGEALPRGRGTQIVPGKVLSYPTPTPGMSWALPSTWAGAPPCWLSWAASVCAPIAAASPGRIRTPGEGGVGWGAAGSTGLLLF